MVFFLVFRASSFLVCCSSRSGCTGNTARALAGPWADPAGRVLNLNDPRQLRITAIVAGLTVVNVLIVALAGFQGVHYMDSVQFCGQVCHE